MSSTSENNKGIEQRDAIDLYLACITSCSLDDEGIECTTKCMEVHLIKDNQQDKSN